MRRRTILVVLLALTIIFIPKDVKAAEFSGGKGSEKDPYIISNENDLNNIRNYCGPNYKGTYFKLKVKNSKLELEGNFEPICDLKYGSNEEEVFREAFYGNFDGNNVEIDNLKISSRKLGLGLFGATNSATIKNITIGKNSSIVSRNKSQSPQISTAGAIVGEAWNTTIDNVVNYANVTSGYDGAGGIVGKLIQNSKITNAKNYGNIKAGKSSGYKSTVSTENVSNAGGIVGKAEDNVTIENVYNSGNVEGEGSLVGGIVGYLNGYSGNRNESGSASLKNATNIGNIVAGKSIESGKPTGVGGIVGMLNRFSVVENVSNNGSVTGTTYFVGGIIGGIEVGSNTISNIVNYNENIKTNDSVDSGLLIGGKIPTSDGDPIKNAYTLKENTNISGIASAWAYTLNKNIESMMGYTSEQLKDQNVYAGFDFDNTWTMQDGKAVLKVFANENGSSNNNQSNRKKSPNKDVTIKFNDNEIDVNNYIYGDGRTFVDLYSFCDKSDLCGVSISEDNPNMYYIQKNIDTAGGQISSSITNDKTVYTYMVRHEKGTKIFNPYIMIGGRQIYDDIANQEGDVISCPDENEHPCDDNTLYVPLRFLTQSFGLRVEWDGETYTVNISDKLVKTFIQKYDVVTSNKKNCVSGSCVIDKFEEYDEGGVTTLLNAGTYYLEVADRGTKKAVDFAKMYSFYSEDDSNNSNAEQAKFTKGIFSLDKNKLTIRKPKNNNEVIARNIAQVIVYEIKSTDSDYVESNNNVGSYPIVINNLVTYSNKN